GHAELRVRILEHEPPRGGSLDAAVFQRHFDGLRNQSAQHLQQRRFARSARAHDERFLPLRDLQGQALKEDVRFSGEFQAQLFDVDCNRHAVSPSLKTFWILHRQSSFSYSSGETGRIKLVTLVASSALTI